VRPETGVEKNGIKKVIYKKRKAVAIIARGIIIKRLILSYCDM